MSDSNKSSPAHSLKGELFDEVPAVPDQTIIAGWLKFRDQKKWKLRWGVVTKLSPAADCLHLQLYRDSRDRYKQGMTKASLSLEHFLGTESGFTLDKESNTVAIICRDVTVILAFDSRERLIQWQMKINYNLGESVQFLIQISSSPAKARMNSGPAKLHIQNHNFCLTCGVPPKLIGYWEIKHLRRYGVVDGKFCFEGGSLCGKGEGLYVFLTDECEEISWNIHMASEGRLIPKRRFKTRNMSVIESPSRRYIQRSSESQIAGLGSMTSNTQNSSCQSFAMYEWASMDSAPDTDSDEKISGDYVFNSSSFQNMKTQWTGFYFEKLANNLNFQDADNRSETNYEPYSYDSTKDVADVEYYTEMKKLGNADGNSHSNEEKAPERPPKPSKFKPVEELENAVIKQTKPRCCASYKDVDESSLPCNNVHDSQTKHLEYDQLDHYDVPKTFCANIQPKMTDHVCVCVEAQKNVAGERSAVKLPSSDYDIPPAAVPVNTMCSCTSKMRVIVESEECHNHKLNNTCPCQHFVTCWPYNWLQLAYCRRGNTIQDTSVPFNLVERIKSKPDSDSTPLYAKVDLSKKTKYKHAEYDVDSKPSRPTEPKPKLNDFRRDSEPNNSYTNLYFENSLKYYENARELIKSNNFLRDKPESNHERGKCISSHCSAKCSQSLNNPETANGQGNYIIMNPICSILQNPTSVSSKSQSVPDSPRQKSSSSCTDTDLLKFAEKYTSARQRSDSFDSSAKNLPPPTSLSVNSQDTSDKEALERTDVKDEPEKSPRIEAARCKPKSSGNRDSSSSNDSGFSIGSLKLHGSETTMTDAETQFQPSIIMRNNSFSAVNRTVVSSKTNRSKSSDPLKDISFQFHLETVPVGNVDVPICHQKILCKKDSLSLKSDGTSSIPFIDSQSTSSETSDISDYIETLSMSSHGSSSDTTSNAKLHHPAASVLRPRSGKEYEKVNRVLIHHGSASQSIIE